MPHRLPRQAQRRAVLSSGAFGEARRLEADGHMKGFLNWLEDHWNPNESKLKTWGQQMPTLTQRGKKHAGFLTQLFHIQRCEIIAPPASPLSFLPSPYRFNPCL
jgi:hypothetical protein